MRIKIKKFFSKRPELIDNLVLFGGLFLNMWLLMIPQGFWLVFGLTLSTLLFWWYRVVRSNKVWKGLAAIGLSGILCPLIYCRMVSFVEILGWLSFFGIGAVFGLILGIVGLFLMKNSEKTKRWSVFAATIIISAVFGGGMLGGINVLADRSGPQVEFGVVMDKTRHGGGRRGLTSYGLMVVVDGEEIEVPVGRDRYRATEIGNDAAVGYYEGTLGIPYYRCLWIEGEDED